jgi:hypothetical protein
VVGLERAGRSKGVIDVVLVQGLVVRVLLRIPCPEAKMLSERRCSKNSGGGIAPAAIGALIEGRFCTVNAFRAGLEPGCPAGKRR